MGLAAAQARLLLLTARKSDLEFRAQQITNAEMMLAMQTEDIARQYSIKMSNQTVMKLDGNSERASFTLADLLASEYNVTDYNGGKFYSEEITRYKLADRKTYEDKGLDYDKINAAYEEWLKDPEHKDSDVDDVNAFIREYPQLFSLDEEKEYSDDDINAIRETYFPGEKGNKATKDITGTELLQLYREGKIKIYKPDGEPLSFDSDTGFVVCYDTSDDREAEAEYQTATAAIQVKEKRLQMELIEIETQQKACETEMESVKKIIDKNIEKSFKYFS